MRLVEPTDGMVITEDTVFKPGVYVLPRGLTVDADGVTVDGNGALLVGQGRTGSGVIVEGRANVTLKNLRIQEYYHGVAAQHCRQLAVAGCHITATAEMPPNTAFLDIWQDADHAYGGGIWLRVVTESHILENDLQHQMCGLLTYHCRDLQVRGNVANYCSGFGFHLYGTGYSVFENNAADFCCRYEPRGPRVGHMGADAAGFLIVHGACWNVFRRNNARMSGDGFFLAGLTPQGKHVGCDDNAFEENDGSYSPNIAFEATFSSGNTYRDNIAHACNYGFWLGFSRHGTLEHNQMVGNRQAGIAVENGFGFDVRNNTFQDNAHGVLLWSKHIPAFARAVPDNDTSHDWTIENNIFTGNRTAIRIAADQDHGIRPLDPSGRWGQPALVPHDHIIRRNAITDNVVGVELVGAEETTLAENQFHGNIRDMA
ncbi:MAG TPA: right-handed parallel beta-helix repeat-containing protein [Anaerolineae bacterium]|nr:right-handed parallel beta-helix repeat-containing protein [Anaerolineae bacterium]HQI85028.1 right-handed parallel beta-helix repeat-containing protein [Anaerolineae bacterium]